MVQVLSIRGAYCIYALLIFGLTFIPPVFERFFQWMITSVHFAAMAAIVLNLFFTNYFNWELLFDSNVLIAIFLVLFHDTRGYRFIFGLAVSAGFYIAYCVIGNVPATFITISEFGYVTSALLVLSNSSSLYTQERLMKTRFALMERTQEEATNLDRLLRKMLPPYLLTAVKDGALATISSCVLVLFSLHFSCLVAVYSLCDCSANFNTAVFEKIPDVTMLYTDLVKFTKMAAEATSDEIVEALNLLYGEFDSVLERDEFRQHVYKVDTIGASRRAVVWGLTACAAGDAYICMSKAEKHELIMLKLGLELQKCIEPVNMKIREKNIPRIQFKMRVGIHTGMFPSLFTFLAHCSAGPALGAIIGKTRRRYNVWGKACVTANKLESKCDPGSVHASKITIDRATKHASLHTLMQFSDVRETWVTDAEKLETQMIYVPTGAGIRRAESERYESMVQMGGSSARPAPIEDSTLPGQVTAV